MKVTVYPHNQHDEIVTFRSGKEMHLEGREGYVAVATSDSGDFLGEGYGLTEADATHAMQEALLVHLDASACAKCGAEMLVKPHPTAIPMCTECARDVVKHIREQKRNGFSLADVSDGQLGHLVREAMQQAAVVGAHARRGEAQTAKAVIAEEEKERLHAEQEARKEILPLPGFHRAGLFVPGLDLSEVSPHDIADAKTTAVYSALRVLCGLDPLDRETTTYADLAREHVSLRPAKGEDPRIPTPKEFEQANTLVKVIDGMTMDRALRLVMEVKS